FNINGISDYADGYNRDGILNDADDHSDDRQFVPLTLAVPPWTPPNAFSPSSAKIKIDYDASAPSAVTRTGTGTSGDPYVFSPGSSGSLRIWNRKNYDSW